jgi:hypothetical protein
MLTGALLLVAGLAGVVFDRPDKGTTVAADTSVPPATTSTSSTTTTTIAPRRLPEVVTFYRDLERAVRTGDVEFLVAHLAPVVVQRYGADQCRDFLGGLAIPTFRVRVDDVEPAAPWQWAVDGAVVEVPDARAVHVQRAAGTGDASESIEHVILDGRVVRWFTDCGTPA